MKRIPSVLLSLEHLLPWFVFAFLLLYTYATFLQVPYVGFDFNPTSGEILDVFVTTTPATDLREGDYILRIGSQSWEERKAATHQGLFGEAGTGEVLPLVVRRGVQELSLLWRIPGVNPQELQARIFNLWFLAYVFWLAGTLTLLHLRPKDTRWRLFIAFYFLTAAWLITGNISRWQVWESITLFRSFIWLCVPVYLHLHWVFPKPFRRIPRWLSVSGYLLAAILAIAEWFNLLPLSTYGLGVLLAVAGSAILLMLHIILQPFHRREAGLMVFAILLAFIPLSGISIAMLINEIPVFGGINLLGLPILPAIYFYVVYRRQLGGLELRANRLISLYLFFILVGSAFIVLVTAANTWLVYPGSGTTNGILAAILAIIVTAFGYPPFKQFVERYILGMPLPPDDLLEIYTARITTSLNLPILVNLLQDEVLPSLLVRQSVLLRLDPVGQIEPLLVMGIDEAQIPARVDIPELRNRAEKLRVIFTVDEQLQNLPWVRLVLPLRVENQLIGFWLLGSRSPDDYYAQLELPVLQTLANQTAIALTNIAQSAQLRSIYQTNIERYEQERMKLARELHDDILNRLAVLGMYVDQSSAFPRFNEIYRELIVHTRQTISGLRPPMLIYGLQPALEEMVDEMFDRYGTGVSIEFNVPHSEVRYTPYVEHQVYRIVQQATENALRHAQAKVIRLNGSLEPDSIKLVIEDDGIGFQTGDSLESIQMLSNGHFGIVGMVERTRLINAIFELNSSPGSGTQILLTWNSSPE